MSVDYLAICPTCEGPITIKEVSIASVVQEMYWCALCDEGFMTPAQSKLVDEKVKKQATRSAT